MSIRDACILILAANGFEQTELTVRRDELRKAGAKVDVATPDGKPVRGWDHTDWGDTADVDLKISQVEPSQYQALVLPGGQINPDLPRINKDTMDVARPFLKSGKPVAAICHGSWLLVEADAMRGRTVTSYKSIPTDVKNAGGNWADREVVVTRVLSPAALRPTCRPSLPRSSRRSRKAATRGGRSHDTR